MIDDTRPAQPRHDWNGYVFKGLVFFLAIGVMVFEVWLVAAHVGPDKLPMTQFLRLIALLSGFPVLLILAMYDKIEKQTAGIILTAIVSFALGQASNDGAARSNGDAGTVPGAAASPAAKTPG